MNGVSEPDSAVDDLVRAAASGDDDAFAQIFHLYHARVWRAAYVRLGNRSDSDDAASDTFVRLHRALPRYRRRLGSPFDAYVLRLADRAAIDVHRRRSRHRAAPLPEDVQIQPSEGTMSDTLHDAFSRLSSDDRELLMLRIVEGRSSDEVAALLRRSPGAVRVAQHRALARLRSLMQELSGGR